MQAAIALLVLLLLYVVVFPIVLAIRLGRARDRITLLEKRLDRLGGGVPEDRAADPSPEETAPVPEVSADPITPPLAPRGEEPSPVLATDAPEAAARATSPWSRKPRLPAGLAENWMIWVGGLALGLSVVFLFRYAIDQGWLTPLARVLLGIAFGGALLGGAEWFRARPVRAVQKAIHTDFIPPVLTGTGVFAVFVSLYAAHALFGLLGPATGFVALGLVAYAALGLSLRYGRVVALVGLVTGFAVPALVSAPEAQAVPLFLYLGVLVTGCLAVMIWRRWWWFAYLTLLGAFLWPALWMVTEWDMADQGTLSAYGLALAAAFGLLAADLPLKQPQTALWRYVRRILTRTSGLGFALSGGLLIWLAEAAAFNAASFAVLGAYALLALVLGAWRAMLEGLVLVAAIVSVALFVLWPEPVAVSPPEALQALGRSSGGTALWRYVIPEEFALFYRSLIGFGALFGLGGVIGLRWARSPVIWAGVAAAMPVILFTIGYDRIAQFETDLNWAATAAVIALLNFAAAMRIARHPPTQRDLPLGLFAAGCTAALSLAIACLLREAWLTVSLAVEVLALAWIWSRLPLRELRALTLTLVTTVIVRLVLNPELLDYEVTQPGGVYWVLYGYGLPALATGLASRLFRAGRDQLTATILEIAAAGFAFLMVALQLRLWSAGSLKEPDWTLFDFAVQTLWALIAAALLTRRELAGRHGWAAVAGQWLMLLTLLIIVLGSVLAQSPLMVPQRVGTWPLVNVLGLAYLAPALVLLMLGLRRDFVVTAVLRAVACVAAGGLVFVYLTLEVRRAFWGNAMALQAQTAPGNAEIYAYSVAWILYALALLALAILFQGRFLRQASMAVLVVAVAKVFLYDMSDLTGLYRVASFLGLGVVLIGIARIYQRFAVDPKNGPGDNATPEP